MFDGACDKIEKEKCGNEFKNIKYLDFKTTVRHIYQNEGMIAFTKGVLPRMSINVPATALSWGTYELIKGFIGNSLD